MLPSVCVRVKESVLSISHDVISQHQNCQISIFGHQSGFDLSDTVKNGVVFASVATSVSQQEWCMYNGRWVWAGSVLVATLNLHIY